MTERTRAFIDSLGCYRKVAGRLGKPESTAHGWTAGEDGKMPARLYRVADETGATRPPLDLFRFLPLPPAPDERAAASGRAAAPAAA